MTGPAELLGLEAVGQCQEYGGTVNTGMSGGTAGGTCGGGWCTGPLQGWAADASPDGSRCT